VKLTRSAGVPFLALSGLLGSTTAETEVTFTTGLPDVVVEPEAPDVDFGVAASPDVVVEREVPGVAVGVLLQPANAAPTHSAASRTAHARSTEQS
jgi:hypothetical protein